MNNVTPQQVKASLVVTPKPHLTHVRQNADGSFAIHDLEEHLRGVTRLSQGLALVFGGADWGTWQACGMTSRDIPLLSEVILVQSRIRQETED